MKSNTQIESSLRKFDVNTKNPCAKWSYLDHLTTKNDFDRISVVAKVTYEPAKQQKDLPVLLNKT